MIFLVGLAGGVGALLRMTVAMLINRRAPVGVGTTVVNIAGALLLGLLVGLGRTGVVGNDFLVVGGVGLLGGFTTFSTWMVETVEASRSPSDTARRVLAPAGLGILAVGVGLAVATAIK